VLLIGPIKHDMQLSDTKASLLVGFAFVFFYLFLGVPIARLVDTKSRRVIIGAGIAIWSLMTAFCGLAQNFVQLFVARIGVGVGEACNGPATFSMMSDLFPREKLPRAIAVLNFGFVAGTGLALLLGGAVIHFVSNMGPIELPLLGALRPWQITFLLVSLPGFLVAALFATVPEPLRRGRIAGVAMKSIPVADVLRFLKDNRWAYGPMFLGLACNVVLHFGAAAWVPTFFIRTYGWTAARAGVLQGSIVICTAPFALMIGSALSEWFTRKGYADANMRVTLIAIAGSTPCAILYPLMPTPELAVVLCHVVSRASERGLADHHSQPDARTGDGTLSVRIQRDRIWRRADRSGASHRLCVPRGEHAALFALYGSLCIGPAGRVDSVVWVEGLR
jgi:MFS family permease